MAYKIRFFTEQDETAMLRWCDGYVQPLERGVTRRHAGIDWFRDILVVLIDTGMRFGELAWIDVSDVDFKVGIIPVHGANAQGTKNGEFRSVPVTKRVREIVRRRTAGGQKPFPHEYSACRCWLGRTKLEPEA